MCLNDFSNHFALFIDVFDVQVGQIFFLLCIISLAVEGSRKEVMLGSEEILLHSGYNWWFMFSASSWERWREGFRLCLFKFHRALSKRIDAHVRGPRENYSFSFCVQSQGACVWHNLNNTSQAATIFKSKVGLLDYEIMKQISFVADMFYTLEFCNSDFKEG